MREIERHGEAGHVAGREPFVGQPDVRTETKALPLELRVEFRDAVLEPGALDGDAEIAQPELHQTFGWTSWTREGGESAWAAS